jgi:hypothetical protein
MFSSTISATLAHEREIEIRRNGRLAGLRRVRRANHASADTADVTIRVATSADHHALERLAQLDSRPTPTGYVLVAEIAGELRAAVPVAGGEPVADPFHPTAALTSLLALRARQLRAGELEPARTAARRSLIAIPNR